MRPVQDLTGTWWFPNYHCIIFSSNDAVSSLGLVKTNVWHWATVWWGYECTDCLLKLSRSLCNLLSVMEFLCNLTDTAVADRSNWSMITFGFQANLPPVMWWNLHCYCCSECSLVLAAGRCACMLNFFLTIIQVLVLGFQVQTHGARMLWWKASAAVLLLSLYQSTSSIAPSTYRYDMHLWLDFLLVKKIILLHITSAFHLSHLCNINTFMW